MGQFLSPQCPHPPRCPLPGWAQRHRGREWASHLAAPPPTSHQLLPGSCEEPPPAVLGRTQHILLACPSCSVWGGGWRPGPQGVQGEPTHSAHWSLQGNREAYLDQGEIPASSPRLLATMGYWEQECTAVVFVRGGGEEREGESSWTLCLEAAVLRKGP